MPFFLRQMTHNRTFARHGDKSNRVSQITNKPMSNRPTGIALPPLILYPFGNDSGTEQLLEGSRAAVALQQASESNPHYADIQQRVVLGRYQEIRMLLFLGKDIFRWIEQCLDHLERSGDVGVKINAQTLASAIVETPPAAVRGVITVTFSCSSDSPNDWKFSLPMACKRWNSWATGLP